MPPLSGSDDDVLDEEVAAEDTPGDDVAAAFDGTTRAASPTAAGPDGRRKMYQSPKAPPATIARTTTATPMRRALAPELLRCGVVIWVPPRVAPRGSATVDRSRAVPASRVYEASLGQESFGQVTAQ